MTTTEVPATADGRRVIDVTSPPTYVLSVSYRGATSLSGDEVIRVGGRLRSAAIELGRALGSRGPLTA